MQALTLLNALIRREGTGFIPWSDFVIGVFATVTLFFLVRIFDEFKDQVDAASRAYAKLLSMFRPTVSAVAPEWIT